MKLTKKTKPTLAGRDLKNYRNSLTMSEKEFGDLIGVTYQAVRLWESGERRIPETTVRLVRLFQKFPQLLSEF